jgi:hypothetical protein
MDRTIAESINVFQTPSDGIAASRLPDALWFWVGFAILGHGGELLGGLCSWRFSHAHSFRKGMPQQGDMQSALSSPRADGSGAEIRWKIP